MWPSRGPAGHIHTKLRHKNFANHTRDTMFGYLPASNIFV
uniref:Uncharacterized protein n=1 Tax=Arundo donax TaxID=35708 RepID=A0A0A8Y9K0_ARUDO